MLQTKLTESRFTVHRRHKQTTATIINTYNYNDRMFRRRGRGLKNMTQRAEHYEILMQQVIMMLMRLMTQIL